MGTRYIEKKRIVGTEGIENRELWVLQILRIEDCWPCALVLLLPLFVCFCGVGSQT